MRKLETKYRQFSAIFCFESLNHATNANTDFSNPLRVVPMREVTTINENQGTTVFHAPKAVVLSKRLERILKDLSSEQKMA